MAIILTIKTDDGNVTDLPLLGKIIIGRSSSTDFMIKDSKMSSSHCSFEITARGEVMFTDLGSTNGSYFNNSKITQTVFKINDVIRIGDTFIRIEEKRLNASERMSIGTSTYKESKEKSLPDLSEKDKKMIHEHEEMIDNQAEKASPKKRTVILDKNIKKKKGTFLDFSKSEAIIDQDPSSGTTKMLKLDRASQLLKKKKS